MKYEHEHIEAKWQKYWLENETFKSEDDFSKPKYYVLDMFPYPSGSGLHVGHLVGYTATDIIARYKRAKGFNVLHPMGWDSFGLPAEQYAIRTNTHPAISTKENIDNFRRQLRLLGFSYDWSREFATSDPSYYKWTQWIFTKLYEKGLAYEAELAVNFCPALGTVLANEEVENGRAKEGGHLIERRPLRQWVLKITAYAERLLEDLDLVDWPESLKKLQINWIGKSEGAYIHFNEAATGEAITVFTTRPDTLFGATYLVLAPEHPLVDKITTASHRQAVSDYQRETLSKSDLDRTELNLSKTGVFTGAYAHHPITGENVPIWIADYVLIGYGTGAIMAVPAHDDRDFAFAQAYALPIVPVYDPVDQPDDVRAAVKAGRKCLSGEGVAIDSTFGGFSINGLDVQKAKKAMIGWLEMHGKGKKATTYKLRDWLFSRQRYWGEPFPLMKFPDGTIRLLEGDELPLCPPEVSNYKPTPEGQSPLAQVKEWVNIVDPKTGKQAVRETHIMPQWAGSCWYYLRFCDPNNDKEAWGKEAENYWMPVDLYVGGVEHAVLHLLYARFWHKVLFDCGYVHTLEPFQTLRNQGLVIATSYQNSCHLYVEPEHVEEREKKCFDKRTGEELKTHVDKMSKSKMNGVSPDEILKEYGADSLRLYEMFMGPLEKEKVWNTDAVSGCRRFLNRFYDMAMSDKVTEDSSEEALKIGNRLINGVAKDIEAMQFNTAIAKLMEFMNEFTKLPFYPKAVIKMAAQALAPLAPHLAEEVWQHLGGKRSISSEPFPVADEYYLRDEKVTIVVQINGKLRARLDVAIDLLEEAALEAVKANPHASAYLEGKQIVKVIFVPNKLINIVVK